MEFYAMLSQEIHICEECGYSTTTGGKEEDILFINEKYNLHFHKTCFLAVLQDNRGQHAMQVVLDALAQYWKDIEGHRLSQYLLQRQLATEASSTHNSTPELDEDYVHLAQDDVIDKKGKSSY